MQQVLKDAGIDGVEQDVFCRKSTQHDDGGLPIICIYPNTENVSRFDEAPKRYKRFYSVVIEIITTHDSDDELCDELDDLSYAVEAAIESDKILQGWEKLDTDNNCLEDTELTSVNYDMQSDGSGPQGKVGLVYSSSYIDQPYIETIPDVLETVETEWKIGDHGDNKAIDKTIIPQE